MLAEPILKYHRSVLGRLDDIADVQKQQSLHLVDDLPVPTSLFDLAAPVGPPTSKQSLYSQRKQGKAQRMLSENDGISEVMQTKQDLLPKIGTTWPFNNAMRLSVPLLDHPIASQFASEACHPALALSAITLYQIPAVRRVALSQLTEARQDPILAVLLGLFLLALARTLTHVPRLIEGLSDDCINLQTALGEDLRVPSIYWRSYEIFHGYISAHFRERPGGTLVASKSYRILVGGMGGVVIDEQKWDHVVSKHLRLTMAMLLDGNVLCPRCAGDLHDRGSNKSIWYVNPFSRRYC